MAVDGVEPPFVTTDHRLVVGHFSRSTRPIKVAGLGNEADSSLTTNAPSTAELEVPPLLDVVLVELPQEGMILSGIERTADRIDEH